MTLVVCPYCGKGLHAVDFELEGLVVTLVCAECGAVAIATFQEEEEPNEDDADIEPPGQYL